MKIVMLALSLGLLSSCASFTKAPRSLTFESIKSVRLNQTTREQVTAQFGKPDKVFTMEDSEEIWLYLDGKYNSSRLSLSFGPKKNVVQVIGWFVDEKDAEYEVDTALARFPSAAFIRTEAEWVNPHAAPAEAFYTDAKLGVELEVDKFRKKVQAISWRIPGEIPVESKREPAKYEL